MDLEVIISWLAITCTIGLFCTGIEICVKIVQRGTSAGSSFFPLLAMFCNSSMWFKYGLIKEDLVIIIVNACGSTLSFIYMVLYLLYTIKKIPIFKQLFLGCVVMLPTLTYTQYFTEDKEVALFYLGVISAFLGVISYGSPLAGAAQVLRTKSAECMAFPMCLANFIVSSEWLGYGYLKSDPFIMVPNGLGVFLGSLQLSLFALYPSKDGNSDTKVNNPAVEETSS